MKLSTLVAYLNHLDEFDTRQAQLAIAPHLDPVLHKVSTHDLQFHDISQRLHGLRAGIQDSLQEFDQTLEQLRQEILTNIESMEPQYLSNSYKLYSEGMVNDSDQHILERRPNLPAEVETYVRARLMRHSDWHYPAMIIRPGLETWINDLVALDPMYLVDIRHELLEPAASRFTPEYKGRLRRYVIQESTEGHMLDKLPKDQMALILAYNYFNFKPLEMIRCFLQEIFRCLRPGGCLMFTFNNCDRSGGVELAERFFMCYTPGRLVLTAAEMIGYETVHVYDIDAAATWVELRRPGELTSLRGGQSLAKIISKAKPRAQPPQAPAPQEPMPISDEEAAKLEHEKAQRNYQKEFNRLKKQAVRLKLDSVERIMRKYTFDQLKEAINNWKEKNERPST